MVSVGDMEEYRHENSSRSPGALICRETWAPMPFDMERDAAADDDDEYSVVKQVGPTYSTRSYSSGSGSYFAATQFLGNPFPRLSGSSTTQFLGYPVL